MLLALDTASPAVTVALAAGDRLLAERTTVDPRRHGELLAPAISALLAEAGVPRTDLTGIAVGVGPGPFTGLRVGLVTALTLGAALAIPVTGVCTLDLIALAAVESDGCGSGPFRVVTDARRKEVHWAEYDGAGSDLCRRSGPHVDRPGDVAWSGPAVGAGARLWATYFPDHRDPQLPSAAVLCRWVAQGRSTLPAEPLYLRRPDATEPGARKRVS